MSPVFCFQGVRDFTLAQAEFGYTGLSLGEMKPMDSAASNRFETEIARYNRWREELTQSVHAYHD